MTVSELCPTTHYYFHCYQFLNAIFQLLTYLNSNSSHLQFGTFAISRRDIATEYETFGGTHLHASLVNSYVWMAGDRRTGRKVDACAYGVLLLNNS